MNTGPATDTGEERILLWLIVLAVLLLVNACQKKTEPEKKAEEQKGPAAYLVNFEPNDSPDLIPANSFYIQQSSAQIVGGQPRPMPTDEQKGFCLDVLTKALTRASQVNFQLRYKPEYIRYRDYRPGEIFEKNAKPIYQVGPQDDPGGTLAAKISSASPGGEAAGSGRAVTLCFQTAKPSRADVLFENGEVLDPRKQKVPGVNWVGGLLWVLETE